VTAFAEHADRDGRDRGSALPVGPSVRPQLRRAVRDRTLDPKEFKRIRNTVRGRQLNELTLGILGMVPLKKGPWTRMTDAAFTFVMLNTAALLAFANFVTGRKAVWLR